MVLVTVSPNGIINNIVGCSFEASLKGNLASCKLELYPTFSLDDVEIWKYFATCLSNIGNNSASVHTTWS